MKLIKVEGEIALVEMTREDAETLMDSLNITAITDREKGFHTIAEKEEELWSKLYNVKYSI